MNAVEIITSWAVPTFIIGILLLGLFRRIPVFDEFIAGAGEGIRTCVKVLPSLVALMTAVSMLQASGLLDSLTALVAPLVGRIGMPGEVVPLALMRPISGSGSLAVLENTLARYGTDSTVGLIACVLQSSTETTFYTIAVYYGTVGIKKTRHTLAASAMGDCMGVLMATLAVRILL